MKMRRGGGSAPFFMFFGGEEWGSSVKMDVGLGALGLDHFMRLGPRLAH